PCYNEAQRLPIAEVERLLSEMPDLNILLVDDGSQDGTRQLLEQIAQKNPRVQTLAMPHNVGKAEAVRAGLLELTRRSLDCVGYADADFATPAAELSRLIKIWESRKPSALLASRVRLLGSKIERQWMRHYLGR